MIRDVEARIFTSRRRSVDGAVRRRRVHVWHLRWIADENPSHGWNQLGVRAGLTGDR